LWSTIGEALLEKHPNKAVKKRPFLLKVLDARNNYIDRIAR
jgi:hypothetical protein